MQKKDSQTSEKELTLEIAYVRLLGQILSLKKPTKEFGKFNDCEAKI